MNEIFWSIFAGIAFVIAAVECFAGYKIMKILIGIWGFFVGACVGASVGIALQSVVLGVFLTIAFGIALLIPSFKFHVAGVFILNAVLSGIAFYVLSGIWLLAILVGVLVGLLSIYFVKPVVILSTAVSGAGVLIASAYKMMGLDIFANSVITGILWIPIALAGIYIQYITTKANVKLPKIRSRQGTVAKPNTSTEVRFPGMQRAYRNFCIRCGKKLAGGETKCKQCGYEIKED